MRQSGKFVRYTSTTLWPPFRLPITIHPGYDDPRKVLLSKTFHAMLFMLLFRAAHTPQEMSEQSLALVIYLIDLGVSLALQQSVSSGNVISYLSLFLFPVIYLFVSISLYFILVS